MKRMISLFLTLTILTGLLPVFTQAKGTETTQNTPETTPSVSNASWSRLTSRASVVASGYCGANVQWTLYRDGTLNIYGTGNMWSYNYPSYAPWDDRRTSINNVEVSYGVTSIGSHAFYDCRNLVSIIIPNSVTIIETDAFRSCYSLTSVSIPDSVTSIGSGTFYSCSNLSSIKLSNSVAIINSELFSGCSSLSDVTIPDSITSIGSEAFNNCTNLTNVTIPDSITSIGSEAFNNCTSLKYTTFDSGKYLGNERNPYVALVDTISTSITSIRINSDTKTLASSVFENHTNLIDVKLPKDITSIGYHTFYNCNSLTSIKIPDSVISIESGAFYNCDRLASIEIPNSVIGIESSAFYDCDSLISVDIPDSVISMGDSVFSYCDSLVNVTISNTINRIGSDAFSNCSSLISVVIPNNITSIGAYAFSSCSNLTSVTLPSSISSIARYAFSGCISLSQVNYYGTQEQWGEISISSGNANLTNANRSYVQRNIHSIAVMSSEKSLRVKTGLSMGLAFGLMNTETEMLEELWRKMAITLSDPTVISVSDYELTEYGYMLQVTGKKQGSTNVTITDTETGVYTVIVISVFDNYIRTYSYAIDKMKVFCPPNLMEYDLPTNIYDLNGIYINNYQCTKKGDTYYVKFDAYNQRYYAGAVDVYDENGLWLRYEEIEKYTDISKCWDVGEQTLYLITDTIKAFPGGEAGGLLTYEQGASSKYTPIELEIKEGEYFTISNNIMLSPGTYIVNALEIFFDGVYTLLDLATSDSMKAYSLQGFKDSAKKSFSERMKEVQKECMKDARKLKIQKALVESMQSKIQDITINFTKAQVKDWTSAMDDSYSEMATFAENIFEAYEIELVPMLETALGVGETVVLEFMGPAGDAIKGLFAFMKGTNKYMMGIQMLTSVQEPYVTVYSKIDEGYINPHGIIVNTNGNIDTKAVLQVFKVSDHDAIEVAINNNNPLEQYEMYNICFVKDDQLVQPSGKVSVRIPIPVGMKGDTCTVYRQETDGSWTVLNARVEGNYLVFETDHFSLYAVIGDAKNLSVQNLPNRQTYQPGESLDTTGLVLDLAGELISDGYLCDPMVVAGPGTQKITVTYGNASTEFTVEVRDVGCGITGSVESREDGLCTVSLYSGSEQIAQVDVTDTYTFQNLTPGTYTLEVSKQNHATRTYEITVSDGDVVQDVKLHLTGYINGDGRINVQDVARIYAWVKKTGELSDYEQLCAEVSGDGRINVRDVALVYGHVKKTSSLW